MSDGENVLAAIALPPAAVEAIARRVVEILDEREQARAKVPTSSPYCSVREAATFLRADRQRIYDLLSAGRLTRFKDGARVLVARAELEALLAGERTGPVAHALPNGSRARSRNGAAR